MKTKKLSLTQLQMMRDAQSDGSAVVGSTEGSAAKSLRRKGLAEIGRDGDTRYVTLTEEGKRLLASIAH